MFADVIAACRRLWRSPSFTVAILLTLALTVGVNAAIFSVADAVLFRPLPYDDPDGVFILLGADPQTGRRFTRVPYRAARRNHGARARRDRGRQIRARST